MAARAILVLCAQALLAQCAFSQCVSPGAVDARYGTPYGLAGRGFGYDGLAYDSLALGNAYPPRGLGPSCGVSIVETTPVSGGSLIVTSSSAVPPVGVSIASENIYEGILAAAGELPFVGTVGVEGAVPTTGIGAVDYGCGDGVTAMESVADVTPSIAAPGFGAFGSLGLGLGYRARGGKGCGYNL